MIFSGGGFRGGAMSVGSICRLCGEDRHATDADSKTQTARGHDPDDAFHRSLL
jgi:hypothetical protein